MTHPPWPRQVGGKLLIGSVEPACDGPHHRYPDDPESVYAGGSEASLTDQWTNQLCESTHLSLEQQL
jgi:hypothetical protein